VTQAQWEESLLSLVIWRESSNQPIPTMLAVGCSIRNRVDKPNWWGGTYAQVITKYEQYSSMTIAHDPNLVRWPSTIDKSWEMAMNAASQVYAGCPDAAQGATHYFDRSLDAHPPLWASQMTHVMDSGNFHFYRQ